MMCRVFLRCGPLVCWGPQPEMGFEIRAPRPAIRGRGLRGDLLARQPIPGRLANQRSVRKYKEIRISGFRQQSPESINDIAASWVGSRPEDGQPGPRSRRQSARPSADFGPTGGFAISREKVAWNPEIRISATLFGGACKFGAPRAPISPPAVFGGAASAENGIRSLGSQAGSSGPTARRRSACESAYIESTGAPSISAGRSGNLDIQIPKFGIRNLSVACKRLRGAAFFDVAVGRFR